MATLLSRFVSLVIHVLSKGLDEFRKLSGRTQALAVGGIFLLFFVWISSKPARSLKQQDTSTLRLITWNVAAVNNNPFEYWLTLKDDNTYDDMMNNVEAFVMDPPLQKNQVVSKLFTESMFDKLADKMTAAGFQDVDKVKDLYLNDWANRKIVTDFLHDAAIGKKRLVSMPDRVTNTIVTSKGTFYRPTPINCYDGPRFTTIASWYDQWLTFMFDTKVTEDGKSPAQLLQKIPRDKYPALTEEEEAISVPLQTFVIAIFDAIQVRMLNMVASAATWQDLRDKICTNLNKKKTEKTLAILHEHYSDANIMFLQETAASFIKKAKDALSASHHVVAPQQLGKNDQNSLILLSNKFFNLNSVEEMTSDVMMLLKQSKSPVVPGDLLVITVSDSAGRKYFLASFHGDTNGLATIPVLKAVLSVFRQQKTNDERFLFGMDANTYEKVKNKAEYQDVKDFATYFEKEESLTSCWGSPINPRRHTTRNARTYMQPQLSKAASKSEVETKGDANPKDFILFEPSVFEKELVARDNSGTGVFFDDMVFPTLDFPSDHAILRTVLREKKKDD